MDFFVVDFETRYSDEYSLSKMTTEAYLRDPRFKAHGAGIKKGNGPSRWVTAKYLPQVLEKLDLENNVVVGHNLLFDGGILSFHYGIHPKYMFDTLGMARAVLGAHLMRHSLEAVSQFLLGYGKPEGLAQTKGVDNLNSQQEATLADYCALLPNSDTNNTWAILKILLPFMPPQELKALDWTVKAFTNPVLYLDEDMLAAYKIEVAERKAQALISAGLEDRKILMSNPKFALALEAFGAVPPTKINAKGQVTFAFAKTDEGLRDLLEHDSVEVQALVAARLEVKSTIEETRTQRLLEAAPRGPWPVPYNYAGANTTQRHSGGDKINPQNFKRGGTLRNCIYAPEGYVLGVADLAQIECRIVLWLGAQSPKSTGMERESLDLLRDGGDLYSWFGSMIYGRTISKAETPLERQIAKSAVLGLGYGMGVARFMDECKEDGIPMTAMLADSIVNLYRNTYKGVRHLWGIFDRALRLAAVERGEGLPPISLPAVSLGRDPWGAWGFLRPSGLWIKYPGLCLESDQMTYRQGAKLSRLYGAMSVENVCQGLAGDIIRRDINEIDRQYRCAMTTHDELVSLVPEGDEELYTQYVTEVMTRPVPWAPDMPLGVEVHTAKRYGMAK